MKSIIASAALAFAVIAAPAVAQRGGHSSSSTGVHWTAPHTTRNGTFVQGHMSTNPNGTKNDNFSTRGNTNPYTGEAGTKPRDGDSK